MKWSSIFLPICLSCALTCGCQSDADDDATKSDTQQADKASTATTDVEKNGQMVIDVAGDIAARLSEYNRITMQVADMIAQTSTLFDSLNTSGKEAAKDGSIVQGRLETGDTIETLLEDADNASHFVNAAAKVFSLRSFRAGQPYTIFRDEETGRLRRFEYEVNDKHKLVVEGDEKPHARLEEIEYETRLEVCEGAIDDSLFQAVADIGESPQLALKLVDLFGSEINFIRDIQDGDGFSVLIEKRYRNGDYKGYGRVLAARFRNRGKTFEAWMFRDALGQLQYYNSRGENLKKTLLMAPLAVTRLTSRFTHARKHPITGETRPHLGVDYGAPTGTPVKAVGDGMVTKRGWAGGFGNQIILRHEAGLESMYGHLSGFARGLKTGQRVRQGQVIGFVGSTGLSTGPHLDFRLRQKGDYINPTKAINPRHAPVDQALMASFHRVRDLQKSYLEGKKLPTQYTLDSIVPALVSLAKDKPARSKVASREKVKHNTRDVQKTGRSKKFTRTRTNFRTSKTIRANRAVLKRHAQARARDKKRRR